MRNVFPERALVACATALLVCATVHSAEPPKLTHLFPAGAQRGTTVQIKAAGEFPRWPVTAWVDRPGVTITSAEEKGSLQVNVDPSAQPGTYWMRLYDQHGATNLRPLVVGQLPEMTEQEPNDSVLQAPQCQLPVVGNGTLGKTGDVDCFAVELKKGQTLVAAMQAHGGLGSPMDAVLQICDDAGFVLEQNDDARGLDPLIVFSAPDDGRYTLRTFAFPSTPNSTIGFAGGEPFIYRLTLTTSGLADHALPLAVHRGQTRKVRLQGWNLRDDATSIDVSPVDGSPFADVFAAGVAGTIEVPVLDYACVVAAEGSSADEPQSVPIPVSITGRIESPGDVDVFQFQAAKGQKLRIRTESDTLGFLLDPAIKLIDGEAKVVAELDDSKAERDPVLDVTMKADGQYRLAVRDVFGHGGFRYVYRLAIEEVRPDFALTVDAGAYVLSPNKPLEIPVTVSRSDGFDATISLTAEGLPEGVSCQGAQHVQTKDAKKTATISFTAKGASISGPFRIVGRSESAPQRVAQFAIEGLSVAKPDLWLTVAPSEAAAQD